MFVLLQVVAQHSYSGSLQADPGDGLNGTRWIRNDSRVLFFLFSGGFLPRKPVSLAQPVAQVYHPAALAAKGKMGKPGNIPISQGLITGRTVGCANSFALHGSSGPEYVVPNRRGKCPRKRRITRFFCRRRRSFRLSCRLSIPTVCRPRRPFCTRRCGSLSRRSRSP